MGNFILFSIIEIEIPANFMRLRLKMASEICQKVANLDLRTALIVVLPCCQFLKFSSRSASEKILTFTSWYSGGIGYTLITHAQVLIFKKFKNWKEKTLSISLEWDLATRWRHRDFLRAKSVNCVPAACREGCWTLSEGKKKHSPLFYPVCDAVKFSIINSIQSTKIINIPGYFPFKQFNIQRLSIFHNQSD